MRSLLSNTSNSISWPIRGEHCCSSPPITAHLDRVRVVGGGDCSARSSCSCPRRGGRVHLQLFNLSSAEVQNIFSCSRYYPLQKCRMRFLVLQYKWMRCSSEGGWHRINLISSCSSVDNIIRRSCTKTAKFKFATDRCSDQGANQLLQNCCHPFRRVNKLYLLFRYDVKVWILSTTKLLWD